MKSKKNKDVKKVLPKVNKELEGLNFEISDFGGISMSIPIDRINEFLNKNVEDKKLKDLDIKPEE